MTQETHPWIRSYDEGVEWRQDIPARPVYALLDEALKLYGERPGFDFLGKKYTWAEIGDLANRFAAGLQKEGIKKGARIGLFLPNCPYYVIAYYGILKAGGTVVNLNPLYAGRELTHLVKDSGADMIVTLDLALMYDKAHALLSETNIKKIILCNFTAALPFPKSLLFSVFHAKERAKIITSDPLLWFDDLTQNDGNFSPPPIDPENDVAVLQYTGGTTGVPKGAMLTHYNVYANAVQSLSWFPNAKRGQQKMLGVLPFFHVFAMTAIMNLSVLAGFEIIALPRFNLEDTLKVIHKKKPHFFPAVPAIYSGINHHHDLKKYDLSSLLYCISGGAPLPAEVKKTFQKITGCILVEGYGLSESSPVVCINPARGDNKAGSIGLPVPGTIVEILNPDDKATPVPQGGRGELTVRGPQVMKGYWNKPAETAEILKNGRLYTGDVAVMDADGYFYIVDRIKDMIITNGYNVYPRNVEEAIYMNPAVEECIVAGLPDEQRGEIVKAWVKLKTGTALSESELKDFLADKISKMEIPKIVEFRDKPLPKTMIGKLSRKDVVAEEKNSLT
jgi:long-chain acyl-CoA synthetase